MRTAGAAICICLLWSVAAAQPAADFRPIADFHHTRWTGEEGAPGETWSIVQTPDGWLWLGGPQGLFRFDGVEFERVPPVGRDPKEPEAVYTLLAEESGDLWVGYLWGGVTHIGHGSMHHYARDEGLPAGTVLSLIRDAEGVVWAATSAGLFRFDGKRWHVVGAESGFAEQMVFALELDGSNALWVMGTEYLFRRPAGGRRFERTAHKVSSPNTTWFLRSADGRLWIEDGTRAYRLPGQVSGAARPRHANSRRSSSAVFDREGHLWSTVERAVSRSRVPNDAERIRYTDVLVTHLPARSRRADEYLTAMLEDREDNIWIATRSSVERFRPTNVRRLDLGKEDTASYALAAGAGALWIGQYAGGYGEQFDGLWKFDGRLSRVTSGPTGDITAAERDANGRLWFAGTQGVWRRELDGRFIRLPALPGETAGHVVHGLAVDGAGHPWVSFVQAPIYRLNEGRWEANGGHASLPEVRPVSHARDPQGQLWFGYRENLVARVATDRVTLYGAQHGLQLGVISAIHIGRFTTVAGERTIALFDGRRFHSLAAADDGTALAGVTGIVEAADGDLWLNGFRGAVRVARSDIENALLTGRYTVPVEIFDVPDGFPGLAPRVRPFPTLVRDSDGRLWFAGTLGIGWLHPEHVRRNPAPPPLHIRSLLSGKQTFPVAGKVTLPVGAHDLEFNFTATSLSRPERIRFRYRLAGYDDAWIEAGSRRRAFYTNLPPGDYRFQVVAANESGVWNEAGAAVSLAIPPTFVQTRTFVVLCVLTGALLIWAAVMLRVKQLTARERSRLEERLGERERIARELHDTLLQSVQGLILKLQTIVDQVDVPGPSRSAMNDALDRADSLLAEGRDRVRNLRDTSTGSHTLKQALLDAAEQMSVDQDARLRVVENGTPRELHPIVREEAARIAIEAMANALRHAGAKSIDVELSFSPRALRINVKDDGRGMEASVVKAGRDGHFGFMGMKERAKRIRGQLSIWSRPGAGTEVNLTVPARMAYVRNGWKKHFARVLSRPAIE